MEIDDDYVFEWNKCIETKPEENKKVITFHNGCECVSFVKNDKWFTILDGCFEAEINQTYWKEI
jgi:hypothetical protein